MGLHFDLCVVGAGMIGSAAARYASADPKLKTCLIGPPEIPYEKWNSSNREIFASHYDEGRITRIFDVSRYLQIFAIKSISKYRTLEELSGISFYNDVGCLYFGTSNAEFMSSLLSEMKKGSFKFIDLSDTACFKSKFPFLRKMEDEIAYLDEEGAGHISPRGMVQAQQAVASKQGCHLIPEVVKTVEEYQNNSMLKLTLENGQEITAKKVVLCTNAFTNFRLLLPKEVDLTINPETVALLQVDESAANSLRTMPSMIYQRNAVDAVILTYILPPIKYPDGKWYLKIGMSGETHQITSCQEVRNWYLSRGDKDVACILGSTLQQLLPDITVLSTERSSCVTCNSPTGLPYIDNATDKITVAIVGNGMGAKWSDEVGRIASVLATTGEWDTEVPRSAFKIRWKK